MFRLFSVFAFIIFYSVTVWATTETISSTLDIVKTARSCKSTDSASQKIECDYKIGKDLHITIAGIGDPDAGITFMKSSFDGDFYGSFGLMHGCVIIQRGETERVKGKIGGPGSFLDLAFISPKNGKVYQTWEECRTAK